MMAGRKKNDPAPPIHGFTLLELVIVLALLAIIAAITVPSMRGFLTSSLARDASTQIVSLTEYARARAAADSTIYRLNFDLSAGMYWITVQDGATFVELGNEFGAHFELPAGMRAELTPILSPTDSVPPAANGTAIDFRPDGSSDTFIVRLIDSDGFSQTIAAPSAGESYRLMSEAEVARL